MKWVENCDVMVQLCMGVFVVYRTEHNNYNMYVVAFEYCLHTKVNTDMLIFGSKFVTMCLCAHI